jgi:hypothetical protein
VATIDDFVNPEKGDEARTDALNGLLIRTRPPPLAAEIDPRSAICGACVDVSQIVSCRTVCCPLCPLISRTPSPARTRLYQGVHTGGVTLHQLVEGMADYLPSKDEVIRSRGASTPTA